jgi:hypothetical protein
MRAKVVCGWYLPQLPLPLPLPLGATCLSARLMRGGESHSTPKAASVTECPFRIPHTHFFLNRVPGVIYWTHSGTSSSSVVEVVHSNFFRCEPLLRGSVSVATLSSFTQQRKPRSRSIQASNAVFPLLFPVFFSPSRACVEVASPRCLSCPCSLRCCCSPMPTSPSRRVCLPLRHRTGRAGPMSKWLGRTPAPCPPIGLELFCPHGTRPTYRQDYFLCVVGVG